MSYHIFTESNVVPSTRSVNIRSALDTSGPHLVTFGLRTTVTQPGAASLAMTLRYETPNGQERSIFLPSAANLNFLEDSNGAIWYAPQEMTIDQYYPLANGPGSDPLGTFKIDFLLSGTVTTGRITYECIVTTFDGGSAVVYHP